MADTEMHDISDETPQPKSEDLSDAGSLSDGDFQTHLPATAGIRPTNPQTLAKEAKKLKREHKTAFHAIRHASLDVWNGEPEDMFAAKLHPALPADGPQGAVQWPVNFLRALEQLVRRDSASRINQAVFEMKTRVEGE